MSDEQMTPPDDAARTPGAEPTTSVDATTPAGLPTPVEPATPVDPDGPTVPIPIIKAAPGDLLHDRYELVDLIAVGGMGEVWRATDLRLNRDVAVKLLKPELAMQEGFRERFRIEARHSALLAHPNVCSVFDYGEMLIPNRPPRAYLVMELVPGEPLSSLINRESPLPTEQVLDISRQAAQGLGAAHAAGVVHRDVKPGNFLVTPDGRVKITDFGVARAAGQSTLTATGQVMGTAQYLSPEQAVGEAVTPASDVYALGVVMYQMLSGTLPFNRETQVATALAQVHDPIPSLDEDVSVAVRELVYATMRKDPDTRPANGRDLASAIVSVESGFSPSLPVADPNDPSLPDDATTRILPAVGTAAAAAAGTASAARGDVAGSLGGPVVTTTATTRPPGPPPKRGASFPLMALLALLALIGAIWGYNALTTGDTPQPAPTVTVPGATVTETRTLTGSPTTPSESPSATDTQTSSGSEASPTEPAPGSTQPAQEPSLNPAPTDPGPSTPPADLDSDPTSGAGVVPADPASGTGGAQPGTGSTEDAEAVQPGPTSATSPTVGNVDGPATQQTSSKTVLPAEVTT